MSVVGSFIDTMVGKLKNVHRYSSDARPSSEARKHEEPCLESARFKLLTP